VGLWTGGLIALIVARPFEADGDRPLPIKRFSFWALFLAGTGIVTGVINAGFVLPQLKALWTSDYGRVLIAKVAILVPVLALATYHRLLLARALDRAASVIQRTLRAEAALAVLVVAGGSILALLAPASGAKSTVSSVDLAAPLTSDAAGEYVRFRITPANSGQNSLAVVVTNGTPVSYGDQGALIDAPAADDVALIRVSLTNLVQGSAPTSYDLTVDGTGWFRAPSVLLGLDGWWRADVLVRKLGVDDVVVPFFFMLPDPNVHGEHAVRVPSTSEDATAVFNTGLTALTSLTSVHYVERLSGGTGTVLVSDHITHNQVGDQPAAMRIATSESELIRMNGFQWVRDSGGEWTKTDANAVVPLSEWGSDYADATGIQLGAIEQVGDRTARIVTFYVPWRIPRLGLVRVVGRYRERAHSARNDGLARSLHVSGVRRVRFSAAGDAAELISASRRRGLEARRRRPRAGRR
jgi:hypothetical protein